MSVKQIAQAATIDAPAATVAVNDLEGRGLVVRETDPSNRRCKVVSLTDAGRDMVRTIDATDDPAPDFLSVLGDAELRRCGPSWPSSHRNSIWWSSSRPFDSPGFAFDGTIGVVATSCGACGAGLRDGARFCDACGSPVTAADSRAEYKQVTVLFADVVRSMDIAAAVGPERLREIMGEVFRRSSTIVQRYGGTVDKFTGDGIMAVFGAPIALEDHAVRACRAALDIQADVQQLADDVERRDTIALQLRIGLNSGEVITGEIGSGPMSYTAIGEQVGMAQRMESVAPPGGVMVSDSTARLVDTAAMLGDTERVHIKGAEDPVPAHRLLGMATGPTARSGGAEFRWAAVGDGRARRCARAVDQRQRKHRRRRRAAGDR